MLALAYILPKLTGNSLLGGHIHAASIKSLMSPPFHINSSILIYIGYFSKANVMLEE